MSASDANLRAEDFGTQGNVSEQSGTSIFDPVLCEIAYRWFCPPGGLILDPFAGGSVRGIVAAKLGRRYVGCDLSARQVEANRVQWEDIGGPAAVGVDDDQPPAAKPELPQQHVAVEAPAGVVIATETSTDVVRDMMRLKGPYVKAGIMAPLHGGALKGGVVDGCVITARSGDQFLGYVWWATRVKTHRIVVVNIATTRDVPGVGCALLDRVVTIARERGVPAVELDVAEKNDESIAWYERRGFVRLTATAGKLRMRLAVPGVAADAPAFVVSGASSAPRWLNIDSRTIDTVCADVDADLVFTCPPYYDLEVYSDDPADLSTMAYADFRAAYSEIIGKACARLRPDSFACVVVGEVRDRAGHYVDFVGDTVQAFRDAGLAYYNEAILITAAGSLPIRAGKQFSASRKLGKTHQNVLVFLKGDAKRAVARCGTVEVDAALLDAEAADADGDGHAGVEHVD